MKPLEKRIASLEKTRDFARRSGPSSRDILTQKIEALARRLEDVEPQPPRPRLAAVQHAINERLTA